MDKHYLSPLDLLEIATQHAYAADNLLQQLAENIPGKLDKLAIMTPITSLLYQAFQLTLRAYTLHELKPVKEYKTLMELVELNNHLGFSNQELSLFKTLSRQQSFQKGADYRLWQNQQQLHVFCEELIALYQRVHLLMPLELHADYQ
ncbi:MAG: hypothetical protein BGO90_01135 [Legionella sp. 40-6]|nr:hypothetical protein [Legionella sp.]OJY49963.1 MAG: hypothetical protein BGO90_01135 [Legionella sp. 40-6]